MNIILISDDSVSSAPAGFVAAVQAAANILDQTFIDPISVNIRYGWGTYNNTTDSELTNANLAIGGPLATDHVSYATLTSWLSDDENSAFDTAAYSSLPGDTSSLPGNANNFVVTSAQEKAFGHFSGLPSANDGAIGFGTNTTSNFWEEGALHEITHALGRETGFPYEHNVPTLMDLFRYNAPGQFQWGTGQPAYFSINGGQTDLADFSTISDFSDLAIDSLTPADPFDYKASNPAINSLTSLDIEMMDVLGFNTMWGAPKVTAVNLSLGPGQSVPFSSIFTVTVKGTPPSQYQVFFGYPEGGSPALGSVTLNGTPIATDQAVPVQGLANLTYTASAIQGTDKIWLKAYNGTWSGWTEADITDQGPAPPVVTPINQTVAYNQSVPIANIFTVTGSGVTAYQIYFGYPEGGAPALGAITLSGSPIALDQSVQLSSLANLAYIGSAVQGTDKIWLKAYDGTWTNWVEADINDPGISSAPAPAVVTPINQTVANGQSVALTSIFSVSGSGISAYQIYFGYPEGGAPALGSLTVNGAAIAQDQAVSLSSLANLVYTGTAASGIDKIWLKAFNGIWTDWIEADITDPGAPPPVVTPINQTVANNQAVPLTNLFSVSGGATQYRIYFGYPEGGAPALGTLTQNGSAVPQDQPVQLSSLNNVVYTGAATAGTDKIWLEAYNGTWTGWSEVDITDPGNPPPVVTPHNQTVAYNQTVPLTSVFSVPSNAVSYIVFFGYPEGGAPALGSVTFLGNPIIQDQSVQIANLADLAYTGAAVRGTDKIWLKAYNGTWSNWAEADITDPGVGGQLGGAVALAAPAVAGVPSGSNTATQPDLADMSLFSNYMASAFPPSGAGMTSTATSAGSESNALADLVASHG